MGERKKFEMLLSFAKAMKPVFSAFLWGRGGFSLPKIRATEVAPTHKGKLKCSFIYAKLKNC